MQTSAAPRKRKGEFEDLIFRGYTALKRENDDLKNTIKKLEGDMKWMKTTCERLAAGQVQLQKGNETLKQQIKDTLKKIQEQNEESDALKPCIKSEEQNEENDLRSCKRRRREVSTEEQSRICALRKLHPDLTYDEIGAEFDLTRRYRDPSCTVRLCVNELSREVSIIVMTGNPSAGYCCRCDCSSFSLAFEAAFYTDVSCKCTHGKTEHLI